MKRILQISKVTSLILSIFAIIGILFGVFKFIENSNANTVEIKNIAIEVSEIKQDLNDSQICQDTLWNNILIIKNEVRNHTKKIDNLRNTFTKHLLNDETLTKDEFYEYMEDLKNGNDYVGASR